jgi:hypothetical protein
VALPDISGIVVFSWENVSGFGENLTIWGEQPDDSHLFSPAHPPISRECRVVFL